MKWLSYHQEMKENGELESVLPKTQSLDERYGAVSIRKRYQLCCSVHISQVEGTYQPSSNSALYERITRCKMSWVIG